MGLTDDGPSGRAFRKSARARFSGTETQATTAHRTAIAESENSDRLTVEGHLHRGSRILRRAVVHHLDVVAIRVEHECAVITRMIGTFTGSAIVASAGGDGRAMESLDGVAILALEGEVHPAGERTLCRLALFGGD